MKPLIELSNEQYDTLLKRATENSPLYFRLKNALKTQANTSSFEREGLMGTIVLIILVLLLVGALPTWPYSSGWGYYPSGGLGLILLILILLLLMGRI
jgi:Protein of unknown function (DUF3309)